MRSASSLISLEPLMDHPLVFGGHIMFGLHINEVQILLRSEFFLASKDGIFSETPTSVVMPMKCFYKHAPIALLLNR